MKADFWAYAVIAYELSMKRLPFEYLGMEDSGEGEKLMRLEKIVRKRKKIQLFEGSKIE